MRKYNSLIFHKLWQELDFFNSNQWSCPDDAKRYRKMVNKERIYDFLAGFNNDLDEVRGWLLRLKPLPSIEEVFSEVRREES